MNMDTHPGPTMPRCHCRTRMQTHTPKRTLTHTARRVTFIFHRSALRLTLLKSLQRQGRRRWGGGGRVGRGEAEREGGSGPGSSSLSRRSRPQPHLQEKPALAGAASPRPSGRQHGRDHRHPALLPQPPAFPRPAAAPLLTCPLPAAPPAGLRLGGGCTEAPGQRRLDSLPRRAEGAGEARPGGAGAAGGRPGQEGGSQWNARRLRLGHLGSAHGRPRGGRGTLFHDPPDPIVSWYSLHRGCSTLLG